jgi:hypothetical protein
MKAMVQNLLEGTQNHAHVFGILTFLNDPILFYIVPGHETAPNSWSCLAVFLTAYLTGVVLLAAYSGALISFLAVQTRNELPFKGFQGLLSDASYRMGVTSGSAVALFRVRDLKFLCSCNHSEKIKVDT